MRGLLAIPALMAAALSAVTAAGLYYTRRADRRPENARFAAGRVPTPLPDGFHRGSVPGYDVSWAGKSFDAATASGINIFEQDGQRREAYPFRTWVGPGRRDPHMQVLKIDYNLPRNPLWVRRILDEVVEVSPGQYLGKVHVLGMPRLPFTLGYFELVAAAAQSAVPEAAADVVAVPA